EALAALNNTYIRNCRVRVSVALPRVRAHDRYRFGGGYGGGYYGGGGYGRYGGYGSSRYGDYGRYGGYGRDRDRRVETLVVIGLLARLPPSSILFGMDEPSCELVLMLMVHHFVFLASSGILLLENGGSVWRSPPRRERERRRRSRTRSRSRSRSSSSHSR
ncbi:unnamed protein product, partial [Brugia pahangi]|uniref:RRM domain-containing protein n=1 Tax=Brugia pahangi TaxID=6280 RepID=A0A0N4T701_BRUPA